METFTPLSELFAPQVRQSGRRLKQKTPQNDNLSVVPISAILLYESYEYWFNGRFLLVFSCHAVLSTAPKYARTYSENLVHWKCFGERIGVARLAIQIFSLLVTIVHVLIKERLPLTLCIWSREPIWGGWKTDSVLAQALDSDREVLERLRSCKIALQILMDCCTWGMTRRLLA